MDAVLRERNDIHVAFHHQQPVELADRLFGFIKAVDFAAFMEHIRLRRVDVLGLVITQCAPAERNGPAATVADREHHPVAKQVPGPPVAVGHGAGFNQWPLQVLAGAVEQGGAGARGVAQLVLFNNAVVQAPLLEVVPGEFTLLAL